METLKIILIILSILLYIMGRLCDDLDWSAWSISSNGLEGLSLAGLIGCALIITFLRVKQPNGWKILFIESQRKIYITWALVACECALNFNIWGCYKDPNHQLHGQDMNYGGCIEYSVVLLLTNYIYSTICNQRGQRVYLIFFMGALFSQIVYDGYLLVQFINNMQGKEKDQSILFVSILVAWQVLIMDIMFRAVYEDVEKRQKMEEIEQTIEQHMKTCKHVKSQHPVPSSMQIQDEELLSPEKNKLQHK